VILLSDKDKLKQKHKYCVRKLRNKSEVGTQTA